LEHKDKRLAQLEEMKSESDLQLKKNSKVVQNESNEKNKIKLQDELNEKTK
jgi:hypothetical protein